MRYAIVRTATRNQSIMGRTLYLTHLGMWTLEPDRARKFVQRSEAETQLRKDLEGCRVVELEP